MLIVSGGSCSFQRAVWIVVGIVYAIIGKGYQVIFAYMIDAWCDVCLKCMKNESRVDCMEPC